MDEIMEHAPIQNEFNHLHQDQSNSIVSNLNSNLEDTQTKLDTAKRNLFEARMNEANEDDEFHEDNSKSKNCSSCDTSINILENPLPSTSKAGCDLFNPEGIETDGRCCKTGCMSEEPIGLSNKVDKGVNTDIEMMEMNQEGDYSNHTLNNIMNTSTEPDDYFADCECMNKEWQKMDSRILPSSSTAINDMTFMKEECEENCDPQDNEPSSREDNQERTNGGDQAQNQNDQQHSRHQKNKRNKCNLSNTKQVYCGHKHATTYFFSKSWVIWRVDKHKRSPWERGLREITSFKTSDEFWEAYFKIKFDKYPLARTQYLIFQRHILPLWKYRKIRSGGHWIIKVNSCYTNYLDMYWLKIMLLTSGQKFSANERKLCREIYGASISLDRNFYHINVYTKTASDRDTVLLIGQKIKEVLNINFRILYVTNVSTFCRAYKASGRSYVI